MRVSALGFIFDWFRVGSQLPRILGHQGAESGCARRFEEITTTPSVQLIHKFLLIDKLELWQHCDRPQ
jgi:hypothetical protein